MNAWTLAILMAAECAAGFAVGLHVGRQSGPAFPDIFSRHPVVGEVVGWSWNGVAWERYHSSTGAVVIEEYTDDSDHPKAIQDLRGGEIHTYTPMPGMKKLMIFGSGGFPPDREFDFMPGRAGAPGYSGKDKK